MKQYLLLTNKEMSGPFTPAQLRVMQSKGKIASDSLWSRDGLSNWAPLSALNGELEHDATGSGKRILPALLLLGFFGLLGAHAFYAGRKKEAIYYLIITTIFGLFRIVPDGAFDDHIAIVIHILVVLFYANFIFLFADFLHLLAKDYKDGDGNKMKRWA